MTTGVDVRVGVDGFIADLADLGVDAHVDGNVVLYIVDAFGGALAGRTVPTGVSAGEVSAWPAAPPHWIHLPDSVRFASTNADKADCLDGWTRHSRSLDWNPTIPPIQMWLAHVRGLVATAI